MENEQIMINIELLKHHSECIAPLALIWYDVLGKIWAPKNAIEKVKQNFLTHLNDDTLPLTYVAFDNNHPIGMGSLRKTDGIRPDLTPWLGSLVVDSAYQKQGVGKLLIKAVKEKAMQLHFTKLYLFAFDPDVIDYYKKLGWAEMTKDECKGHPVTIMEIGL